MGSFGLDKSIKIIVIIACGAFLFQIFNPLSMQGDDGSLSQMSFWMYIKLGLFVFIIWKVLYLRLQVDGGRIVLRSGYWCLWSLPMHEVTHIYFKKKGISFQLEILYTYGRKGKIRSVTSRGIVFFADYELFLQELEEFSGQKILRE
jgi:hypothetical protein